MNLTRPDDTNRRDRLCVALALLMSPHCVLAPLIARAAALLAGATAHLVLGLLAVGLSLTTTLQGWLEHHEGRVFAWALPAWALLAAARFGGESLGGEAAEILVTVAHQLNRSLAYWHRRD